MSSVKTQRAVRYFLAFCGLIGFLILLQVLFDPMSMAADLAHAVRIRWELPRAREKWESLSPTGYRIDIKGAIPLACILDGQLTVMEDRLEEIRLHENPLAPGSPVMIVDRSRWETQSCPFQDLTVEGMFDRVAGKLESGTYGAPLRVVFDKEFGFVREYRFGRSEYGGIFGPTVSECCTWFEYENLEILSP